MRGEPGSRLVKTQLQHHTSSYPPVDNRYFSCSVNPEEMLLLLLFGVTLLQFVYVSQASNPITVIYVDPENGIKDPNCWTGGINLPCKDYDLAKEGALYLKVKIKMIISLNEACQQTWMYDSNGTCQCGKEIHGAVSCSNNPDQVSILRCNCMTYDNTKGFLVGRCLYGCGKFLNASSSWSQHVYHPLPMNVSRLNNVMCGRLNRDGRLCSKCCLLYTSPSPRDATLSRMPSSA